MIRKAKLSDAKALYNLINSWAKQGRLLGRSLNYLYENIRDFWIFEEKNKIIACCALHIVGWQDLGEIKSLVVAENFQQRSIGTQLVSKCLEEAENLGIKKVFALTFVPKFFKKLKFKEINMKVLPHKIWSDCVDCVYFPDCKEKAVLIKI